MVDTIEGTPDPAPPSPRTPSWGDRVRMVLRGIGQLLITAGVIVLLFVVYEVYVTNYFSHEKQAAVRKQIDTVIDNAKAPDPTLPLPGQSLPKPPDGKGLAILYIPRLGNDYSFAIVQGVDDSDLEKGPGHYKWTQMPGQLGDFGVAGHRVGKGEPFLNLDHLRAGDPVIVETKSYWYVYTVLGDKATDNLSATDSNGVPGREIVNPGDGNVLLPVPDHPGKAANQRYMTMTTCHPKFTAAQRMIVHAVLTSRVAPDSASPLKMPAEIAALYNS
jgi:sortase A